MNAPLKINLIVVGCGKWGSNLVSNAHSMQCLVAIVDSNKSSLMDIKGRIQSLDDVPVYLSLDEALAKHEEAAVIIATPPSTHFSIAMKALKAGRDIFVEKPLCDSVFDAHKLLLEAQLRHRILMVDHLLQYSLSHRQLIQAVALNFVGRVTRVRMSRVNFGTVRTVEDVLWSFCPHDLSILLAIVSASNDKATPKSVVCQGQAVVSSHISDYVDISVTFSDGSRAQIEASWLSPLKERRVIVYGTNGSLILNEAMPDKTLPKIQAFKWSWAQQSDGTTVKIEKTPQEMYEDLNANNNSKAMAFSSETQPLRAALEHFGSCVMRRDKPRTDGDEALRVLALLNAAAHSLKNGGVATQVTDIGFEPDGSSRAICSHVGPPGFVHETAIVDNGAILGAGTKIWHFSHVMGGAVVGSNCNIGQNVYIGGGARLGNNVKVQNNVSIYDAVEIEDDVFLGPSCVLTNVKTPRSHVSRKHKFTKTIIRHGVTVGANATIVCGITLNKYCFVGAGAVVTKDVPPHALVYGNPASIHGWVSTAGIKLQPMSETTSRAVLMHCPESKEIYELQKGINGTLQDSTISEILTRHIGSS